MGNPPPCSHVRLTVFPVDMDSVLPFINKLLYSAQALRTKNTRFA